MILKLQKRLAASVLNCSPKRVVFDPARLEDIKEAITKTDIRLLLGEGAISERPEKGVSRFRANKRKRQKSKGLRRGEGSRKGKATAHRPKKEAWMNRIRAQRKFLKYLKENNLLKPGAFKELYVKSKGGFFRSIKHIKLHIHEHDLMLGSSKDKREASMKQASQGFTGPEIQKSMISESKTESFANKSFLKIGQKTQEVQEKQEKPSKAKSKQPSKKA